MKLHSTLLTTSLIASLLFSSCASKFTPAQKDALSTVSVSKGSVGSDSYEDPYGGDLAARNAGSNVHGAGALGVLVGAAVGASIAGTQNNMFVSSNKAHFDAVKRNTPSDLGDIMSTSLNEALKKDSFFSNRLKETSGNTFASQITTYRLIRIGKNDRGELVFSPEIYVDIALKNASGKTIFEKSVIGNGVGSYPISEYANSSKKSREAYTSSVNDAVANFMLQLSAKTKP